MKKLFHLSLFYLLLLSYCLEAKNLNLSSHDANISERSTQDFLVSFSPAIILESGEACWGVRVNENIATSSVCSEEIRKRSANNIIRILDSYDLPVAEVAEMTNNNQVKNTEMLVPVNSYDNSVHHQYATIRNIHPEVQGAYSYSYDDHGVLQQTPVNLISKEATNNHLSYFLFNQGSLLSGAPVFDSTHNIICIVSTENQCETLRAPRRLKRSADNVARDTENEEGSSVGTTTYIIIGVSLAGAVILTNLACLGGLHVRACQKGMPIAMLWSALADCRYCVDPHTNYCLVAGWWGVACSWVSAYRPASEDRLPVFQNMHQEAQ